MPTSHAHLQANMESVKDSLVTLGWHLSPEGLIKCQEACEHKGWTVSVKNIAKAAQDLDLRSIGTRSLPVDIARSAGGKITSPLILQIQRVKNVAVPSTKQHMASPNRRLLRLQVTDGQDNLSAIESDGSIDKLIPVTPPGTKLLLTGNVTVVNGFILLTRTAVQVLGGQVEALMKKWTASKGMSDSVSRNRTGTSYGPPPFVPLSQHRGNSRPVASGHTNTSSCSKAVTAKAEAQQSDVDRPTRAQMDRPQERAQRKPDRKPETSSGGRPLPVNRPPAKESTVSDDRERRRGGRQREEDDYQPSSRPKTDYQLADFFSKKLQLEDSKSERKSTQSANKIVATTAPERTVSHQERSADRGTDYQERSYRSYKGGEYVTKDSDRSYSRGDTTRESDHRRQDRGPQHRNHGDRQTDGGYKGHTGTQREEKTEHSDRRGNKDRRKDGEYRQASSGAHNRGQDRERQQGGQRVNDRARQHGGQRVNDRARQHGGQRVNDRERQQGGQRVNDREKNIRHEYGGRNDTRHRDSGTRQGGSKRDSQHRSHDSPPTVREAWLTEDTHWDWISSSAAVPFTARKHN